MLLRLTSADGMRYASMATVTAAKKKWKRNCLTLKKKVEVIKYAKKNPLANIRDLGEKFSVVKPKSLRSLRSRILYCPCMSPMPLAVESMIL